MSSLKFRMGVNLGDIIDDGTRYPRRRRQRRRAPGNPGGTGRHLRPRRRLQSGPQSRHSGFQGYRVEHQVKNVSAPIRVYRLAATGTGASRRDAPPVGRLHVGGGGSGRRAAPGPRRFRDLREWRVQHLPPLCRTGGGHDPGTAVRLAIRNTFVRPGRGCAGQGGRERPRAWSARTRRLPRSLILLHRLRRARLRTL